MEPMVVPYHPTATSIELWVANPLAPVPVDHKLVISKVGGSSIEIPLPLDGWRQPSDPAHPITWIHVRGVDGLTPGSEYHVLLQQGPNTTAEAHFETLPARLPAADANGSGADRPFTVLLGSCNWVEADDGTVAERYGRLYAHPAQRPHLKFLVGDQVYIDQPPTIKGSPPVPNPDTKWGLPRIGSQELINFINARYRATWGRLHGLLSLGSTICSTDDHEFWNDFPNPPHPVALWPALHGSETFRNATERVCRDYVENMQRVRPVESFVIGTPPQLSVFVADTRIHREVGTGRFMKDADMDKLVEWVAGLRYPGVLVISQPIFAPPFNRWSGLFGTDIEISDRNLPAFEQFTRLAQALQLAPHDVCILSGDVHFGQIASVELVRDGDPDPMRIFQVIASPMSQLDGANAIFEPDKYPSQFPDKPEHGAPGVTPGHISYGKSVPTIPGIPLPGHGPRTEEHFMTVAFSAVRTGDVRVRVSAWILKRTPGEDGLPHLTWREEFTLFKRGGVDISGARSLLLDQDVDISGARSLLLGQDVDISAAKSLLLETHGTEVGGEPP